MWEIALHGYEHKYTTQSTSLVPINNYSEFAGLTLEVQKKKIKKGIDIFKKNHISTRYGSHLHIHLMKTPLKHSRLIVTLAS